MAELETFKFSSERQLVYGKNYVCVHQVREGETQHCQGYLTLHSSSAGPIVSWTPFSLMVSTKYQDPEEPPEEADLAVLVAMHNVSEIVVETDRAGEGAEAEQSVVFVGVDGVALRPLVFHTGGATAFVEVIGQQTDITPKRQAVATPFRQVHAVCRLPTLEPPSVAQAPHPATICRPPCERCKTLLAIEPEDGSAAPFSIINLPKRSPKRKSQRRLFSFGGSRRSSTDEANRLIIERFQIDAAERKLRRCFVAWRVSAYRIKTLARDVHELVIWDQQQDMDGTLDVPASPGRFNMALQQPTPPSLVHDSVLTRAMLQSLTDSDGCITDGELLCSIIFTRGCDPELRPVVWKYLLGMWDFGASAEEREAVDASVQSHYSSCLASATELLQMEKEANADGDGAEDGFMDYDETSFAAQCTVIDLDVDRCDRSLEYYQDDATVQSRLNKLRNVLRAFVFEQRQPGYVQGMSDVLEPILAVFDDEASAFFCFSRLMRRIGPKFDRESERGIQACMSRLRSLISFMDPELAEQLRAKEADHLYFCYRWFLLDFKREFPADQVFAVWETIWAGRLCVTKHFPIFIAYAVLSLFRDNLMRCGSFPEILKLFNSLQATHDADAVIASARQLVEDVRQRIMERADRRMSRMPSAADEDTPDDAPASRQNATASATRLD